jgi:hypothetical protein
MSENPYSCRFCLANAECEHAFGALSLTFKLPNDGGGELHVLSMEQLSYLVETAGEVRPEMFRTKCHFHSVTTRARAMANEDKIALQTYVLAGHPVHRWSRGKPQGRLPGHQHRRVRGYKIARSAVARTGSSILRRVPC